ncbi:hypothetical protein RHSIM_Rhsim09G0150100 [Rhododendron simsii]|uniref:Uncharacterized protein n=1 Tax=Rhododendron simsii TaxID=118357 RepID=A0A834GHH8_RHOSS|nr:hypothetical protein RHSIM_Rhsim09G0150100 [Rhododendron simsii]
MAAKKLTVMCLAAAFVAMAFGTTSTEADANCVNQCMPGCMQVQSATTPACEDACDQFCKTQGAPPFNIWSGLKNKKESKD